ncbi:MAG: phosphodiester glycosidase family protein [Nitratireductor sp.]|nr:phosphodiester glycosidase family protein [Nitratireductor sp.]
MNRQTLSRALVALPLAFSPMAALAQESDPAPERTLDVREALAALPWQVLEDGLELKEAISQRGIRLRVFRISVKRFALEIVLQNDALGERVEAFGERSGAVLAVNGGFFGETEKERTLFPVGYLRIGGEVHSQPWQSAGGYLSLSRDGVSIRPSREGPVSGDGDEIQSKPLLIEPGGKWAMNTNQQKLRPRTVVCTLGADMILIAAVSGSGMSLYEAGWLMRDAGVGGYFGCDAALAMDGGGSTQLWVAGEPSLQVVGETPVNNALVVRRR